MQTSRMTPSASFSASAAASLGSMTTSQAIAKTTHFDQEIAMEDDFDPLADCPECGAEHGYSEWEVAEGRDDAVRCPSCGAAVAVDDLYPLA